MTINNNEVPAVREAFEAWARTNVRAGETNGLLRKEGGEYLWSGTSFAWDVWQAALASMPTVSREELELAIAESLADFYGGFQGYYAWQAKHLAKHLAYRFPHLESRG